MATVPMPQTDLCLAFFTGRVFLACPIIGCYRNAVTVDSKLLEALKILSIRKELTANWLLEEAIAELQKKYGETQEAKQPENLAE